MLCLPQFGPFQNSGGRAMTVPPVPVCSNERVLLRESAERREPSHVVVMDKHSLRDDYVLVLVGPIPL